jgi:hypothetical protein
MGKQKQHPPPNASLRLQISATQTWIDSQNRPTGFLALGAGFLSYVRTSARSVQNSVKDSVPVEFEFRRARDLIEAILPELQAQVRMIAQEEVEIAALEAEVDAAKKRL